MIPKAFVTIDGQQFEIPPEFDAEQRRLIQDLAEQVSDALDEDVIDEKLVIELQCQDNLVMSELAQFCRSTESKFKVSFVPSDDPDKQGIIELTIGVPA